MATLASSAAAFDFGAIGRFLIAPPARDAQRPSVKLYGCGRRGAPEARRSATPRRTRSATPRPSAAAPPAASYPLPARRRLFCSLRMPVCSHGASRLVDSSARLARALAHIVAPDCNSERESRECEALEERAMGLEPTTLSLGSASSTAWLSRFRATKPNTLRWNPLGTAAAGW